MNRAEVDSIERAIAQVVKWLRAEHAAELEPLRRRVDLLEQRLDIEQRMARLEQRFTGADGVGPTFNFSRLRSAG
jgi:hypothetical protein